MPEQPATGTFDEGPPAGVAAGSVDAGSPAELAFAGRDFVGVLQSSRYVVGDLAAARAAARADAEALRAAGLEVIREKVEAVSTNDGV
ncbi:MAG TPA: hypothetical protein VFS00_07995, partial [Polyangiaceae bacterium]|nr:hypothetical protein [Polyangiaceae bacterium]